MQLDAWRLRMPTMYSLTRNLVNFALFYMRVIRVSSFWPPTKICTSRKKLSISGSEWMQLDAWRLKLPKMCSLWRNLLIFAQFCMRVTKNISLWPPAKICTSRKKLSISGSEWMQLDAWMLKLPKMCSLWRFLVIFALFCMRVTKVSSYGPPTKICTFRRKKLILWWNWMQLDAWRLRMPTMYSLWLNLLIFALLCKKVIKVSSFDHLQKLALFSKKGVILGANGCN